MALKCDVCGKTIHLKKIDGKNYPVRCPLEKYKVVKTFYTKEFKQVLGGIFQGDICQSNEPEGLLDFAEMVPEKTPLMDHVKKYQNGVFTKNLIIHASKESFFLNFNRVLIDLYDDNKCHFVDCIQEADNHQFNYLWLTPSNLRECYFRNGLESMRFKSMSELTIPSLVIYPIGGDSIEHKGWGDILLDMLTNRNALGKPTWIVKSKEFSQCQEVNSSEKLRSYLNVSGNIPTVELDLAEFEVSERESNFVPSMVNKNIKSGHTITKTNSNSYMK